MKKIDSVVKHSSVIAISNNISLLQRKLFNYLVWYAYYELDKKEEFTVSLWQLTYDVGFNSNNYNYLKECLRMLKNTEVEFNVLWKDKTYWGSSNFLASAEFRNGVCYYAFSPLLKRKLYNPNLYAKINLNLCKVFQSKYSLVLYELFIDYGSIKQTPIISLNDFRKLMGLDSTQYSEFKRLNAKVIIPAIKEVNSIVGLEAKTSFIKEARKVTALKFTFKTIALHTKPKKVIQKIEINSHLQSKLITKFGLTLRQANNILQNYPIPYIEESLDIVEYQRKTNNHIKNIASYTLTVIKNDYQKPKDKWSKLSLCVWQTGAKKAEKPKVSWINDKIWLDSYKNISKASFLSGNDTITDIQSKKLSCGENKKLQQKAKEYFYSLKKEEQEGLIKEFEKQKIDNSSFFKGLYEKEWIQSPLFRVMFFEWIEL